MAKDCENVNNFHKINVDVNVMSIAITTLNC